MKTASWIIKKRSSGRIICETFDAKAVDLLRPEYVAVPILEHLASLNRGGRDG